MIMAWRGFIGFGIISSKRRSASSFRRVVKRRRRGRGGRWEGEGIIVVAARRG